MLVLYHAHHSTCSQKVRLVLHEKGLPFEAIQLNLGLKDQLKPDYLALNPNGVVPTLVDDGVPIIESSVICEYLDEKFPQNPLVPSDLVTRARMRAWMHYIEEVPVGAIRVPSFNRAFLYRYDGLDQQRWEEEQMNVRKVRKELFQRMGSPKGFAQDEVDRSLGELTETCRRMDEALAKEGPWLVGAQFTLADVLVMPTIDRMADLGLAHIWESKYPRVAEWYARLQEKPSFQATYYPGSRVSDFLEFRPLYAERD
ncbi:glutathione S-transferase family protein [Aquabacter spiritensis]|uniref:Glutathione S-transferase n=1 Tax=Aquabacter spiritensis TaxID=933073 RepID=A0A4R3LXN7_9HYPH|nr:glutathione S-transferase family protein [Aquabacter spiritensis]TCT03505.1 glutathione S-transferase [Aquabacter spiritensis]